MTHHEFDLFKCRQILFVEADSPSNDITPSVSRYRLNFDRILMLQANRHIFDPVRPYPGRPAIK